MQYREETMDLFSVPENYCLAHCISADFGMGKGIVVEFNKRFDMKNRLKNAYPEYLHYFKHVRRGEGDCLFEGKVFNLITKERYWGKPTYQSLRESLDRMKCLAEQSGVKKIAMPVIGCGLDKLEWDRVSAMVQDVFKNTDVEILVCKQ